MKRATLSGPIATRLASIEGRMTGRRIETSATVPALPAGCRPSRLLEHGLTSRCRKACRPRGLPVGALSRGRSCRARFVERGEDPGSGPLLCTAVHDMLQEIERSNPEEKYDLEDRAVGVRYLVRDLVQDFVPSARLCRRARVPQITAI